MTVYETRRRAVLAVLISTIATVLDLLSSKGSGWSFFSAWGFFTFLTVSPLVLGYVLDEFGDL